MNPRVSVVIPAYNHAHFLGEAIESVLGQDYEPIEVVVVNDGSTDATAAVVAAFPSVTYVAQPNRGLAEARNAGLARCRGDLVVFLDADDRLLPGAVRTGVRVLTTDPSLSFAAGYSRFISADGTPQPTNQPLRRGDDPYVALLRRNSIRNPAMVIFRRPIFDAVGGFDPAVNACADYELYLRISRDHTVAFHDEVVADYRKHGSNMSDNSALMLRELGIVMRRQRRHLITAARREAFSEGLRNVRTYYGDRLVNQIRARVGQRTGWARTAGDLATLLRHHPAGLIEHVRRKIRVLRSGPG
jgi:glycosyltransferase involved in cell wall biosynthesis